MSYLFSDGLLDVRPLLNTSVKRLNAEVLKLVCVAEVVTRVKVFNYWLEQISKDFVSLFVGCVKPDCRLGPLHSCLDAHLYVASLGSALLL